MRDTYLCPICDPQTRLPIPDPNQSAAFVWESGLDSTEFISHLNTVYLEVVHWRQNLFTVPSCSAGCCFVKELSSLFGAYIWQFYLSGNCGPESWKEGDLLQLLKESRTIQ